MGNNCCTCVNGKKTSQGMDVSRRSNKKVNENTLSLDVSLLSQSFIGLSYDQKYTEFKDYSKKFRNYQLVQACDNFRDYTAKRLKSGRDALPQRAIDNDEFFTACLESDKVLKLYDVFDEKNKIFVYESIEGGTLADLIKSNIENDTRLTLEDTYSIMNQLIDILLFLKEKKVVYGNFKPENIVFTSKNDINSLKIMNFELAQCNDTDELLELNCDGTYVNRNHERVVALERLISNTFFEQPKMASIKYTAPEIILGDNPSYESDLWSVGIIFYLMLTNIHPLQYLSKYVDLKEMEPTVKGILESASPESLIDLSTKELESYPSDIVNIVSNMLQIDPLDRNIRYTVSSNMMASSQKSLATLQMKKDFSFGNFKGLFPCESQDALASETTLDCSLKSGRDVSYHSPLSPTTQIKVNLYQRYGCKCTTPENVAELANLFDSSDVNKTGYVSRSELELFYSAMIDQSGLRGNKSKYEDLYNMVDSRKMYSKQEFVEAAIIIKNIFEPDEVTIKAMYREIQNSWGNREQDLSIMCDVDSDMAYVDFLQLMKSTD